jgi:tRNA (guanine37-N1)-methyltransferase
VRVDVITVFPDYLAPLELSLVGKARARGLLDVRVHDLRQWTHDRHRTVDDTPYGGGAGMVMRPEPWGEALDAVLADAPSPPVLVVPTPSGRPFSQSVAQELAREEHLVIACGRYEGIDQRVVEHAAGRMRVLELSLGDYVLNGGEVAALAVVEAVARLLPGFMGNAASLEEESHGRSALLEYPVYTKPPSWRGLDVPEVLLGGDHARIAAWRHAQALRRTAERRPDLLHPSGTVDHAALDGGAGELRPFRRGDLGELMTLQWACFPPPERESMEQLLDDTALGTTFVLRAAERLVGTVRGRLVEDAAGEPTVWEIGLLMVAPDLRGRGLGGLLLAHAEAAAHPDARTLRLLTGAAKEDNLRWYRRAGYSLRGELAGRPGVVVLTKPRRR